MNISLNYSTKDNKCYFNGTKTIANHGTFCNLASEYLKDTGYQGRFSWHNTGTYYHYTLIIGGYSETELVSDTQIDSPETLDRAIDVVRALIKQYEESHRNWTYNTSI